MQFVNRTEHQNSIILNADNMDTSIRITKKTSKRIKDYQEKKKLKSQDKAINHALSIAELYQLNLNK